jgi:hypothetical protein
MFAGRTLLALYLGLMVLGLSLVALAMSPPVPSNNRAAFDQALRLYSVYVFATVLAGEILVLAPVAAAEASAAFAEESQKGTLPLLLLTRLTRLELAVTKLLGRLFPALLLLLTGLPFLLFAARGASVPVVVVIEALAMLVLTVAVAGSLGILSSSRRDAFAPARSHAIGWTMAWLVGLPVLSLLPARSGTIWGDFLVEVSRLASWLAPSSPFSLLTDRSWYSGRSLLAGPLSQRLLIILACQVVLIGLALAGVVANLRLREPHPNTWDIFRGSRPPVGDDPIYWREYVLPWRGSRLPLVVLYGRHVLICLRVIVMTALQVVLYSLAIAVPVGLAIAAGWYSYHAFLEQWVPGSSPAGSFEARNHLNWYVRVVTFMLGGMSACVTADAMASRIVFERDKRTWEPLLATPLSGEEILSSKMRVVAGGVRTVGRWLTLLWVLGIVCGALHPLGPFLAAAGLLLTGRLGLALGAREALRPGPTNETATSVSSYWTLPLMVICGATGIAPLCSTHDLDTLRAWDPRLPGLLSTLVVGALVALAMTSRRLTRHCFERFDGWVGRPHQGTETAFPEVSPIPAMRSQRVDDAPPLNTRCSSAPAGPGVRRAAPGTDSAG